jgi:SHAQKYF class myb-like DNA-binding protein
MQGSSGEGGVKGDIYIFSSYNRRLVPSPRGPSSEDYRDDDARLFTHSNHPRHSPQFQSPTPTAGTPPGMGVAAGDDAKDADARYALNMLHEAAQWGMHKPYHGEVAIDPLGPSPSSRSLEARAAVAPAPFARMRQEEEAGAGEMGGSELRGGRWTDEEHELFLDGYKRHGKSWKDIAALVMTRTPEQIRTHAQKFFQKKQGKPRSRQAGDAHKRVRTDRDRDRDRERLASATSGSGPHGVSGQHFVPHSYPPYGSAAHMFPSHGHGHGHVYGNGHGHRAQRQAARPVNRELEYPQNGSRGLCGSATGSDGGALLLLIKELEDHKPMNGEEEDEEDNDYDYDPEADGMEEDDDDDDEEVYVWDGRGVTAALAIPVQAGRHNPSLSSNGGWSSEDEDEYLEVEDDGNGGYRVLRDDQMQRADVDELSDGEMDLNGKCRDDVDGSDMGGGESDVAMDEGDLSDEDSDDEDTPLGRGYQGRKNAAKKGGAVRIREGRWSKTEHNLFLKAYKRHGKAWKEISNTVRTRTPEQIRTHAQKYFQKAVSRRV